MKLRKLAAALLVAALGMSLSAPALAADAADVRLTKVTQAVKAALALSDEYEEFYGEPEETVLGPVWSLSWSSEGKRLNVSATEEGKEALLKERDGLAKEAEEITRALIDAGAVQMGVDLAAAPSEEPDAAPDKEEAACDPEGEAAADPGEEDEEVGSFTLGKCRFCGREWGVTLEGSESARKSGIFRG